MIQPASPAGEHSIDNDHGHLDLLGMFLLLDASTTGALRTILLLKGKMILLLIGASSTMILLLENRIGFDGFELGLKVADVVAVGATVRATASIGEVVSIILGFFTGVAPLGVDYQP